VQAGFGNAAVWLGPGHIQNFIAGIPNCMVIDSNDPALTADLCELFSGGLIRFYLGSDLTGNELGAAAKNVIGIAAGMLDGMSCPSLKGPLMARGAREISRVIAAAGGSALTAYGLCHLGDYETTLFSEFSNNRNFGQAFIRGEKFKRLAEGVTTSHALLNKAAALHVELPITAAVYSVIYEGKDPRSTISKLFERSQKQEF
ncbi:MAG: glycerol-3-phosphate dehydrogenase, partial [Firmicutes bacterium]|nr:glycerol-3-phosphate dehydrogenase [Bacillota bacterium]